MIAVNKSIVTSTYSCCWSSPFRRSFLPSCGCSSFPAFPPANNYCLFSSDLSPPSSPSSSLLLLFLTYLSPIPYFSTFARSFVSFVSFQFLPGDLPDFIIFLLLFLFYHYRDSVICYNRNSRTPLSFGITVFHSIWGKVNNRRWICLYCPMHLIFISSQSIIILFILTLKLRDLLLLAGALALRFFDSIIIRRFVITSRSLRLNYVATSNQIDSPYTLGIYIFSRIKSIPFRAPIHSSIIYNSVWNSILSSSFFDALSPRHQIDPI